jgi:rare lipoprotein A
VRLAFALPLALVAASCGQKPLPVSPHYVLGAPYQAGGAWYYPRESYEGQQTGLAMVYPPSHAELTTDGEAFDQTALAAAHQTLQLPAIARLTNLENGLAVVVRINDRGPATPHRLIEVTRRTASLLRFADDNAVRVRLEVLAAESYAAVDAVPGTPRLEIVTAPLGAVRQSDLPPVGSAAAIGAPTDVASQQIEPSGAAPALRLPEAVEQGAPDPGQLFVRLGKFQGYANANMQRERVAGLGARIVSTREGRIQTHLVIIGPLSTVQQADMVLDQARESGVTDARIVVE